MSNVSELRRLGRRRRSVILYVDMMRFRQMKEAPHSRGAVTQSADSGGEYPPHVLDTNDAAELGAMVWIDGFPGFLQLELAQTIPSVGVPRLGDVGSIGATKPGDLPNLQR